MKNSIRLCLILLPFLFLTGCGDSGPIKINISASKHLNQNREQKSLPVHIKIYQLSSVKRFSHASFSDLWHEDGILGKTLLSKKEIIMNPGKSSQIKIRQKKGSKYIGIIAIFRQPNTKNWKVVYKILSETRFFALTINVGLYGNKIFLRDKS